MKYISTTDIETWAKNRQAQGDFPHLVRRLVQASPVEITTMLFPVGNNVGLPGFDGLLEIIGTYQHLPAGRSVWEFGSGKDYRAKATRDFLKRTNEVSEKGQADLTFIFVTPYVWHDKNKWITNKAKKAFWKGIRIIDGLQLEEWIETLPSVGAWVARLLSLPQGLTLSIDQWWDEWNQNSRNTIPISLLLNGREKETAALTQFLQNACGVISIKSNTADEVCAFIASALQTMDAERGEKYFARGILTDDETTLRDLSLLRSPMLILSRSSASGLMNAAAKNGHHVIAVLSIDHTISNTATIELPRINRRGFEKGLEEMGFDFEERERVIKNCGLSLTVLRRQLGFDRYKQPLWASNGNQVDLIPALLVGRWDEQNEVDKELISELAGEPYETYVKKLARWKIAADAPLNQVLSVWRITSPLDAWSILAPFVTHPDIQKFRAAFLHASGELNPALELDIDKRYMANLLGKIPKYSYDLKEGLIVSLILIGVFGESFKLSLPYASQAFVDRIIRELLQNADGPKWCSLSDRLPLLAEASPEAFLSAVENSLKVERSGILEMFQEGRDLFYSTGNYHTGLLWALENLAYSQEYLLRVTLILGTLSRLDPGGRLSNRPINSLQQIHVAWYRQVNADLSARKSVLERLMQKEPDAAWDVLLNILPDQHGEHTSPIHSCRWRFTTQLERTVSYEELFDLYAFAFDQLLVLAKANEKRMSVLVDLYSVLSPDERAKLLKFLEEEKDNIINNKDLVWDKLRCLLSKHRAHSDQPWALPENELKKIEFVFEHYTYYDGFRNLLYLFKEPWPEFPTGRGKLHTDSEDFVKHQRTQALKTIYDKGGLVEILKMIPELSELRMLGETLAELILTAKEESILVNGIKEDCQDKHFLLSSYYLFTRSIGEQEAFTEYALRIFLQNEATCEAETAFFLSLCSCRNTWNILESRNPLVAIEYWKKTNVWLNRHIWDDRIYAISKLQQANRHVMLILQVSYFAGELTTDLLSSILLNAGTIPSEGKDQFDDYPVCILFKELQSRSDVEDDQLFNLEWLYIFILTDRYSQCMPNTLFKRLSSDPKYFVDLLTILYKSDIIQDNEISEVELEVSVEEEKLKYKRLDGAQRLLESWRVIPGTDNNGSINAEILKEWINSVRLIGKESNRLKAVDMEIGKLLACYPRNNDLWPCETIADIIDSLDSHIVVSHFETEIFNSRGVTMKAAFEGGTQERSLSFYFEKMSNLLITKYPVTGAALGRIARDYKRDGVVEDERAHFDELR